MSDWADRHDDPQIGLPSQEDLYRILPYADYMMITQSDFVKLMIGDLMAVGDRPSSGLVLVGECCAEGDDEYFGIGEMIGGAVCFVIQYLNELISIGHRA